MEHSKIVKAFKDGKRELSLAAENINFEFVKAIGRLVGKTKVKTVGIPEKEWSAIFNRILLPDYPKDMAIDWSEDRKLELIKAWCSVIAIGRCAWSDQFMDAWPKSRLLWLSKEANFGGVTTANEIGETAKAVRLSTDWWLMFHMYMISRETEKEIYKHTENRRQLVEMFLTSDIDSESQMSRTLFSIFYLTKRKPRKQSE